MTNLKNLIKEMVTEVLLQEKLRGSFNFTQFKKLSKTADSRELLRYLLDNLGNPIGEGSSRTVFVLSSNKVLKLAVDQSWTKEGAGRAQNEAEVEVATNPKVQKVVARVYDFDSNFKWILSELTKPLTGKDIRNITGLESDLFEDILRRSLDFESPLEMVINHLKENANFEIKHAQEKIQQYSHYNDNFNLGVWNDRLTFAQERLEDLNNINVNLLKPVINGILAMKKEFGFNVDDLLRHDHYGKTADGRLVVIDYGFTKDIGRKYYAH